MKEIKTISPLKMAEMMNRLEFFRALTVDEKRRFIEKQLIQVRMYRERETLIEAGGIGDEFFMLLSGHLSVLTPRNIEVATLEPGDIFGEVAFILNEKRTATIVADTNVMVMVIDHKILKSMPVLLRDKIKDKLLSSLVKRVASLNERLESFLK